MSVWAQVSLQDSNSSIMEMMINFHDYAMLVIMIIIIMIFYMMIFMIKNSLVNRYLLDNQMIEIIWTLIPMIFLLCLALPSLNLLYLSDEMDSPVFSVKAIGHQWYWSYELNDFNSINFDSFMLPLNEDDSMFRLLDVDNRLILPVNNQIRLLVNSSDVIHSFALPSLGIKVDAVPGRLNQIKMNIIRPGLYFGQCSEICGVNHSFMPIVIEATSLKNFLNWLKLF
uniref:Cytochrome c oxidase subunit 2 n=1 Tax=Torymus sp. ZJUH_2016035 TaxID=2491172 RepID=A0A3Q8UAD5_9HYME|nr:cytochrome c oxidase subunit 2 [Torymus sp. ZJUH_2016035]